MKFLEATRDQMVDQMVLVYPNEPREKLEEFVEKKLDSRIKDRNVMFNDGESKQPRSLLEMTNWLETEQPILTGYGAFYKKHDEGANLLSDMVDYLLKSRKVYKKEMFKHVNDVDRTAYNNFDLMQKTMKLLANSFYGATVEKNSIFFNENFGPSITYNGVIIITTAVKAFETFMSNNFYFKNFNDILRYMSDVTTQHYSFTDIIDNHVSKSTLLKYFLSKWHNKTQEEVNELSEIIKRLDQETIDRIYYKNNLYAFLENPKVTEVLEKTIDTSFLNPEEPTENNKEAIEKVWSWLNEWVLYNHLSFYRYADAYSWKRKTVLVVDTDSNFLMLDPFHKYFMRKFPQMVDNSDASRVSTVNIATFFLAEVIKNVYWKMTSELNVPHDKRPIINMKNEFFYKRLMMTRNKKSYAGELIMQEGHMFEKPKMDIKGLAIRKVSVNKQVRDYFTEMLKTKILSTDEINLGAVFGAFNKLQDDIKASMKRGEVTYLQPGKVNEMESYKTPYTIQALRGAIIWNALYPDKEIVPPTKVNLVKLNIESLEDIAGKIPMEEYTIIKETIFDNENLAKYGFSVLAMPKSAKRIPEWLVPFINVDTMVNDHVKSGIIMLESLGFKTLDILTSQFPTNVLDF
jgi:DNA polymerase family B